jgi:DNA-binding ferritin-like protein
MQDTESIKTTLTEEQIEQMKKQLEETQEKIQQLGKKIEGKIQLKKESKEIEEEIQQLGKESKEIVVKLGLCNRK